MIVGIVVIVSLVACIEWLSSLIPGKTNLSDDVQSIIVAVAEAIVATTAYIFIFRLYEKRRIHELSPGQFMNNAVMGFLIGSVLQALVILIIYFFGSFIVVNVNHISALVGPVAFALSAGFVAEILLIGIVFRLLEQQTGTSIALFVFIILFAVMHVNVKGASAVSIGATAMQAGLLLPASFVYRRNLWLPIFLHFGWDLAEPGIFGGINPSSSLTQGLLTSRISGNILITGGETGPQDSLSSLLFCLFLGFIFLLLAKQRNNLIKPYWRTTTISN